ncbi:MAG: hypothetical protein VR73_07130 [Gammaproteobacteria bacterium BRH_c0]|nr:MAG: hypothetical protein VR73_07130 [Gammaproteobacteria bacterium BRH_c0]
MVAEPTVTTRSPRHQLEIQLDNAIARLDEARSFAKPALSGRVLDICKRALMSADSVDLVYDRIAALERSGIFDGSDWATPEILQPLLAANTLRMGNRHTVILECLSQLRFLAVARGDYFHPSVSSEHAQHFLSQVLALNLNLLFDSFGEAEREREAGLNEIARVVYLHLVEHIGYENIFDRVVDEVWRILAQRPIQVDTVKTVITQIAVCMANPEMGTPRGGDRLVSALFNPSHGCREDPGFDAYMQRLQAMDEHAFQQEAGAFARAMHDTGLVSVYHTVFLRDINERRPDLLPAALGLSSTGREVLLCYQPLIQALIDKAIFPETAQGVYGLATLLERGILYHPAMAPALWRQLALPLSDATSEALTRAFGNAHPAHVYLLAGVLNTLGQPLGVGQGNNPTCQAARAISMWSYNDPDYLLQVVAWAARDNEVVMHFEGQPVSSRQAVEGLAKGGVLDVDPVSLVVAPHLDRIYMAMGQLCMERGEDPHRRINPEFHGWWVGRGFHIAVDVASGLLSEYETFLRYFYASYHPYYNGNQPVIHPQPAGIAVTNSAGRFVGWHAITLLRVALDQEDMMRAYFFNPNNDSGQDWGDDVIVSTSGHGERFGEASLPVQQFASRLYLFHYDSLEPGSPEKVPEEDIATIVAMARATWASER